MIGLDFLSMRPLKVVPGCVAMGGFPEEEPMGSHGVAGWIV
jgi:hypothetical protein